MPTSRNNKSVLCGAALFMKLTVSRDGTMLAFTDMWEVTVFEIVSWEPFQFRLSPKRFVVPQQANAFWPVISPDSKYLITQEVAKDRDGLDTSYLRVYNLETFKSINKSIKSVKLFDLDAYNHNVIFVTDWR